MSVKVDTAIAYVFPSPNVNITTCLPTQIRKKIDFEVSRYPICCNRKLVKFYKYKKHVYLLRIPPRILYMLIISKFTDISHR